VHLVAVGSLSLLKALTVTRGSIAQEVALAIVFETINGMSKLVPMLPRHMQQVHTTMGFKNVAAS
jgi:hypothetical protein